MKALGLVVSDKKICSCFPYICPCKHVTPGRAHFRPRGIIWTNLMMLYAKCQCSSPCGFRQEDKKTSDDSFEMRCYLSENINLPENNIRNILR